MKNFKNDKIVLFENKCVFPRRENLIEMQEITSKNKKINWGFISSNKAKDFFDKKTKLSTQASCSKRERLLTKTSCLIDSLVLFNKNYIRNESLLTLNFLNGQFIKEVRKYSFSFIGSCFVRLYLKGNFICNNQTTSIELKKITNAMLLLNLEGSQLLMMFISSIIIICLYTQQKSSRTK